MKNKRNLKAITLSLELAVMTLAASNLNAQDLGLFGLGGAVESFSGNGVMSRGATGGYIILTEQFGSDANGGYQIGTEQFGQDAPLGSGLFIMAAAGAAYALKKRKMNK